MKISTRNSKKLNTRTMKSIKLTLNSLDKTQRAIYHSFNLFTVYQNASFKIVTSFLINTLITIVLYFVINK